MAKPSAPSGRQEAAQLEPREIGSNRLCFLWGDIL